MRRVLHFGTTGILMSDFGQERITAAAVKISDVVCFAAPPLRHPDIRLTLERYVGTDGFLTNHGRFVNRREGYIIAKEAGQMLPHDRPGHTQTPGVLYTEDLW